MSIICKLCVCGLCVFAQIIGPMHTTYCVFTEEAELSDAHLSMF